ncbi:MAG: ROK family transcriptional regulator [Anaerolineae bacterium]|nr:ROK family transcriptional regulator [Anaerolineae bacterium]
MIPNGKKLTRDEAKSHNQRLVLRLIYQNGEFSRADVARASGLTRTTASAVVSELMEQGLVEEIGLGPSGGGKPPTLLQVPPDARHLIGLDLAGTVLEGAVFNLRGQAVHRASVDLATGRSQDSLQQVLDLLDRLVVEASQPLLGIGVGLPGVIDSQLGVVYHALSLGWPQLALGDILHQRYQLPVYLVNDSQGAALAEYTFAREENIHDMAVILVAQGVSAGIILGGQLYRGRLHSGASEIGHVRVTDEGYPCVCGHYGCLDTIVGEQAVLQGARTIYARRPDSALGRLVRNADEITMATVATAYQQNDPAVLALGSEMAHYLGIAAANLYSVLNVPQIVLAGGVAAFGPYFAGAVEEEIRERTLPWLADRVTVRTSTLGEDAVELGAAAVLLANELGVV